MGRPKGSKNKPKDISENIPSVTNENVVENTEGVTTENVIIPTVENVPPVKVRRGGNLKASFELKPQQTKPQDMKDANDISPTSVTPQIDYDMALNSLWSTVDTLLGMMAFASRGKLEYKQLTKDEIQKLTDSTKNNSFMQKLASAGSISTLLMIGTIAFIFKDRFKIKKDEVKHNEKDKNCKCKKCKVLEKSEDEPQQTIDQEPVKEETINDTSSSSDNVNTNGVIIQENNFQPVSEQKMLENNTDGVKKFEF